MEWCRCGVLEGILDARMNKISWEHDTQGRIVKEIRADDSFRELTYEDTTSRLSVSIDAKGQEAHYSYFADNNIAEIAYEESEFTTPSVSFQYDSFYSRRISMTDGIGTSTYSYYPVLSPPGLGAGLLSSVDGPYANDMIGYEYNELGRIVSRTLNGTTTSWEFDASGRLMQQNEPIGAIIYEYVDASKRLEQMTYPNGQSTVYSYYAAMSRALLKIIGGSGSWLIIYATTVALSTESGPL